MNKYIKLANYFDSKGMYKSADAIESFVKTSQSTFIEKQPDLAKIEQRPNEKIANDIVYYAASVTQGTRTPSYDLASFFTTIEKIEKMKSNPLVKDNFPKIYGSLDAAVELLKTKSGATSPGAAPGATTPGGTAPGSTTPGSVGSTSPGASTPSVTRASRPDPTTTEGKEFDKKIKTFVEEYKKVRTFLGDIKRHQRDLDTLTEDEKDRAPSIRQKIRNYQNLVGFAMQTIDDPEYGAVRKYLRQEGRFDPNLLPEDHYVPEYEDDEVLSAEISTDASSPNSVDGTAQPPVTASPIIKKKILGLD
jgi:hypothetical protein